MTKKQTQKFLDKKLIDATTDIEKQKAYVRSQLGEKASDSEVLKAAEKRVAEASKILSAIEKPLGTSDRPFPMQGTQRIDGNLETVLSVIADDSYPMKVYSDRPYKDVVALAYCDMPVPSMLSIFFDGLERRKPESTNRTQMMIGDPGHGKSFLGALQGRLRSTGPVEVYDCGGKNMNDLLFEMVLDFGAGDALPKAIDKRLASGSLEPMSVALLQDLPCARKDEAGNLRAIDWAELKTAGTEKVEQAYEILKKVSKIEGLDNAGGNALGMNSQYGALIRAFLENREIVLDEYNKSREGSDNALQTVWQFMIGEIKECTVENPLKNKDATSGPSYFSFKREDTGLGFFVTLTGNRTEDGTTTRSLNKSVYSRLSPDTLPYPEVIDWQHRICQMMVGMPVSTLYMTFRESADANPDAFGQWLIQLRQAKAEIEGTPIPDLQLTLLNNWKDVVDSSFKLAKFYNDWATLTDAEKIMVTGNADLVEEVDEEYTKKEGIDFRKIKQHLEQAIPLRPSMQKEDAPRILDMKSWEKAPKLGEKIEENPSLNFGTRLTQILEDVVYLKSGAVGKRKLYQKLQKSMETHGLRSVTFKEAQHSRQKSVEQALNISPYNDKDMKKQALLAQKVFCDYIRSNDNKIVADNEDIVSVKRLQDALNYILRQTTDEAPALFVPNRAHETMSHMPLVPAVIKDSVAYQNGKENGSITESWESFVSGDTDGLVDHADLMASFALPTVTFRNVDAIWDKNIRSATEDMSGADGDYDEGMKIAENTSDTGIALSSLMVKFNDNVVPVHIIKGAQNKTLIISEKVPTKLLAAFKEAGIIHVDRHAANAEAKIEAALTELTHGQTSATLRDRILDAFSYRNDTDVEHLKGKTLTLPKVLADDKVPMYFPRYLMKAKNAA